jgi:hypothetical protein
LTSPPFEKGGRKLLLYESGCAERCAEACCAAVTGINGQLFGECFKLVQRFEQTSEAAAKQIAPTVTAVKQRVACDKVVLATV